MPVRPFSRITVVFVLQANDVFSIVTAYELTLQEGLHFERRLFHMLFATVRPSSLSPSYFF